MKKSPLLLIVVGLLSLAVGAVMEVTGAAPTADASVAQACRTTVQARGMGADMATRCSDAAFAAEMTATDANAAARAISAANSGEVGSNMVAMFLIGLGLALAIGGVALRFQQRL